MLSKDQVYIGDRYRQCIKCEEIKSNNHFRKHKKGYVSYSCDVCEAKRQNESRYGDGGRKERKITALTIECRKCGEMKPKSDFFKTYRDNTGYNSWCKQCSRENARRRQGYKAQKKRYLDEEKDEAECTKCGEIKSWSDFMVTGLKPQSHCRKCQNAYAAEQRRKKKMQQTA